MEIGVVAEAQGDAEELFAEATGSEGWGQRWLSLGRSSRWMERTAQRCSGAFSLRIVARRWGSYSKATRAHEDGGSGTPVSTARSGGA
jgi:hypothetical protein